MSYVKTVRIETAKYPSMPPTRYARPAPLSAGWRVVIFLALALAIVTVGVLLGRQTFRLIWGNTPPVGQTNTSASVVAPPMTGIVRVEPASPTPPTTPQRPLTVAATTGKSLTQTKPYSEPTPPPASRSENPARPQVSDMMIPVPAREQSKNPPRPPASVPSIGDTLLVPAHQTVIVRRGPSDRLARIARLDGGSRVQVKFVRNVGKTLWLEISLGPGKSGWVQASEILP